MIGSVPRLRTINPILPAESAPHAGLAYTLWLPAPGRPPKAGIVILHGAGSCKESHHDFARAALALDLASIAFDQRGHGESDGPMDARAIDDVVAMADLLRACTREDLPVALRGSSMGGYLAIMAAPRARAAVVVAICPASGEGLLRGLRAGTLQFDADVEALQPLLEAGDLAQAVADLDLETPLLLLHAEGDEQVPVEHSRELASHLTNPASRLITVPGGHHRSVQHDEELWAISLKFVLRALA